MTSPDIVSAVEVLRRGGLVAFPTETVYGLGADASNPAGVARIFAVKGRPRTHPLIVHLAEAVAIKEWAADVPADAWTLAEAFWPGPLTLILPRAGSVPDAVTGGAGTVGLRVPDQPLALELLHAFGGGIAAPSANRFGRVSPTTAAHVRADLGTDVDLILDGGPCAVGVESTIVDLSRATPRVLRLGGLSVDDLSAALGHPVEITAVAAGIAAAPPARSPAAGSPGAGSAAVGSSGAGSPVAGSAVGSPGAGSPGAGSAAVGSPGAGSPGAGSAAVGSPGAGSPDAGSAAVGSPGAGSAVAGSAGSLAAGSAADLVPAPGTLASHYAPEARVELLAADEVPGRAAALLAEGRRIGVLAPRRIEGLPAGVDALPPAGGPQAYAQCLYQRLREADRRGLDVLLAVPPPPTGIGAAVADRLRRAAAPT